MPNRYQVITCTRTSCNLISAAEQFGGTWEQSLARKYGISNTQLVTNETNIQCNCPAAVIRSFFMWCTRLPSILCQSTFSNHTCIGVWSSTEAPGPGNLAAGTAPSAVARCCGLKLISPIAPKKHRLIKPWFAVKKPMKVMHRETAENSCTAANENMCERNF